MVDRVKLKPRQRCSPRPFRFVRDEERRRRSEARRLKRMMKIGAEVMTEEIMERGYRSGDPRVNGILSIKVAEIMGCQTMRQLMLLDYTKCNNPLDVRKVPAKR
jgi:hypothetical protein